jgi:hypothetical protein
MLFIVQKYSLTKSCISSNIYYHTKFHDIVLTPEVCMAIILMLFMVQNWKYKDGVYSNDMKFHENLSDFLIY